MTIAMIGQKGLPARSGGIERHVSLLASGLASRGHRVIVYGRRWYVAGASTPEGIEQHFTSGIHTKHLDAITHSFTALWAARAERPDVIHIHGSGIALLTPIARLFHPNAKVVVTFHSFDGALAKWNRFAKSMFRLGEWLGCHTAHRMIAVSEMLTRYCLDSYGYQVTYIPHPFPLPTQQPDLKALVAHNVQPDQYLLFVGRLIPDKQAHLLVRAYAAAREQRPDLFAQLPLLIVGGGSWTDRYVKWLYQLSAGVPNVTFVGERCGEELHSLQAHALAHVFPTSSEGLSIAMLEAAAYRRPIVVTDLPQNREATGGHAVEVKINDLESLSNGLIAIAEMSQTHREQLGHQAYQYVAQRFDASDRLDDMDRLYEEVVRGHGSLTTPAFQPVS